MSSALKNDLVLGIETSCDETAAAVLRGPRVILSNVVATQVPVHRRYGGVVPELASRQHILSIDTVVNEALEKAGVSLQDLGGIAVTYGPGLVGSLLVGLSLAKGMALVLGLPLAAVNHHEGHIRSIFIENEGVPMPCIVLMVSGGDTSLYLLPEEGSFRALAHTRDDAAGEAYDKVAKLLGLGYPGGPIIDRLARQGDPKAVPFSRPRMTDGTLDFSFSGLKTAVLRHVQAMEPARAGGTATAVRPRTFCGHGATGLSQAATGGGPETAAQDSPREVLDLLASFQETLVSYLVDQTVKAARAHGARSIGLSGGVACNSRLREAMREAGGRLGVPVFHPSPALTTDNAAMIAAAGHHHLVRGRAAGMSLNADPSARL
ncbi:MAG TPA: tRNA (adenosine(37)-N6)-threonylcarbamoyltransferase complex transferase subunit TsaD [Candidatus Polarisedimenticolia bacterium]|nr:tRNA (adenosine(37)-N6)-threonylcarbamoyltransferase complex transferase subunit TsaD [Candidatus Polarisedimenticolia bacterium]